MHCAPTNFQPDSAEWDFHPEQAAAAAAADAANIESKWMCGAELCHSVIECKSERFECVSIFHVNLCMAFENSCT